jgi:TonB family protein
MGRVASAMADPEGQKADKDSSQARVARWTRDASGEANARADDLPLVWHNIATRIQESFHPPRNVVTRASTAAVLGRQLLNTGAARSPMDTSVHPLEPPAREASLAADVMAGQAAARQPAAWIRAEVRVEVGPDGLLRQAEITTSSGKAAFDKLAMEAVCAAIAERPILDGCRAASPCTTRLRWAVEAALQIEPPPVMVPSDPRTGGAASGITPLALRFSFDETSGKVRHHRAFASEVRTRVKLLSID